jgi:hypothetical protein
VQLPAIIGADFNLSPKTLLDSTYVVRSGLCPIAPSTATYRTAKTATILDYFLMGTSFAERVLTVEVLTDFPLRPHSPVRCYLAHSSDYRTPVLEMPPRLPLVAPIGPMLPPRCWQALDARLDAAIRASGEGASQRDRQRQLDAVYGHFVEEFERQVSERTDTPRRQRTRRGRAPRVRWVAPAVRSREHRPSWRTLVRPLQWIQSWVQDVLRYLSGAFPEANPTTLMQDLEEPPSEFRDTPSLIGLHQRAQVLVRALAADGVRRLQPRPQHRQLSALLVGSRAGSGGGAGGHQALVCRSVEGVG